MTATADTDDREPSNPLHWAWDGNRHDPAELARRLDAYAEHARWSYNRIKDLEARLRAAELDAS